MDKKAGFNVGYLIFALPAVWLLREVWTQAQSIETVPYSTFEQYLRDGKIDEVAVGERLITGRLKSPESGGKTSVVAPLVEPLMAERLCRFGVTYTRVFEPTWFRELLSRLAPTLIFFVIWFFVARNSPTAWAALAG